MNSKYTTSELVALRGSGVYRICKSKTNRAERASSKRLLRCMTKWQRSSLPSRLPYLTSTLKREKRYSRGRKLGSSRASKLSKKSYRSSQALPVTTRNITYASTYTV